MGLETVDDLLRLVLLDDALPAQHGGVRHGALDVLLIQPGANPMEELKSFTKVSVSF